MLFIALVLVPGLRGVDPALRTRLVHALGLRFRLVAWIALTLLVLTGLGNLWMRPALWGTPRFLLKAWLVGVTVILSGLHDFVLGLRAGRPQAPAAARAWASWVARLNALVALAIVALGLSLRG